jgi:hypothetical protein
MAFDLEKLIFDVFAPQEGDVLTLMVDLPHDDIPDMVEWQERREMAEDWHRRMAGFAKNFALSINPLVTYEATGGHARDLPEFCLSGGRRVRLEDLARDSTIIISMTQFSASAPLMVLTKKYANLRVASMPLVSRAMQETGLSADYHGIAENCARLAPLFDRSEGVEVLFSTGHTCYFDISDRKGAVQDNGRLHPGAGKDSVRWGNLPSGEVFVVPNESPESKTRGEIPVSCGSETAVFVVHKNQVTDVRGEGPAAVAKRREFREEKALRNIAEVAIGCNEKAVVSGNPLEDEKAGFHWAYGRSDFLGGMVSPADFSTPGKVEHHDSVYARGNPIVCQRFDFIFPDGSRKTVIEDGVLSL